jgi:1,4-dihydroxy-2-naphthoyl-CoA hydrolase
MTQADPDGFDSVAFLNSNLSGWSRACGLRYVEASEDEVVAQVEIGEHHLQPHGIVHGGVHCGLIETTCSAGAVLCTVRDGRTVVGLDNSTSFLRPVRAGTLRITATPRVRGHRTHVWEATVRDEDGLDVATGRVRMICLEPGAKLAGAKAEFLPPWGGRDPVLD